MEQYKYLLVAVFDRPIKEAIRNKSPEKGFMQFGIWKKMTKEQFDCLYRILNTKTLNEDQRYAIFHNSIYIYNSVLKETSRVKNRDKIRESQKKYREANRDTLREKNKKYREANRDKINARKKINRAKNRDKINAQRKLLRAKYRRDKNGTNN